MPALNNDMVSLTLEAFEVFAHQLRVTALAIVGVEGDCLSKQEDGKRFGAADYYATSDPDTFT